MTFWNSIKKISKKKKLILIIYLIALILFNIKIDMYQKNTREFADETSHIAYIAYLKENKVLIPKFKEMQEFETDLMSQTGDELIKENQFKENTVNHLGHPPLYYHIMNLFNVVQVEGEVVTYNLSLLRNISQAISNVAIILAFYIGYKKLKTVLGNFIYSMVLISVPLLAYVAGAVQNDVLSFLGVNIYIIGMMNLCEHKRGYLTYFLIAIGCFITFFSKLTASTVVVISYILIVLILAIKEKNLKFIFCKKWAVTLPIYAVVAIYYILLLKNYGTIAPELYNLAPEYLKTTLFYNADVYKPAYPLDVYAKRYWTKLAEYWAGINVGKTFPHHKLNETIPSLLIFSFPILNVIYMGIKKKKMDITSISISIGVYVALIIQFCKVWYEFQHVSGFLGGYYTRYYVCTMAAFSLLLAKVVDTRESDKIEKTMWCILTIFYVGMLHFITMMK